MSIKIETTKVVTKDGVESYRIDSIEGVLTKDKLPKEYLAGYPCAVYSITLGTRNLCIYESRIKNKDIGIGELMPCDLFQQWLEILRQAGDRLHRINKKIRKRRKTWRGKKMFVI